MGLLDVVYVVHKRVVGGRKEKVAQDLEGNMCDVNLTLGVVGISEILAQNSLDLHASHLPLWTSKGICVTSISPCSSSASRGYLFRTPRTCMPLSAPSDTSVFLRTQLAAVVGAATGRAGAPLPPFAPALQPDCCFVQRQRGI